MADPQPTETVPPRSDEDLWRAYVEGEDAALDGLIRRHTEDLFWYLFLSTGQQQTAGRHLMRTWDLVASYRGEFDGFDSFKSWLYAVATQNAVPANHPEDMGLTELVNEMTRGGPIDRRAEIFFRIGDLRRHLRQPFLLVTVAGLNIAEAAKACNFTRERTLKFLEKAYRRLSRSPEFRGRGSVARGAEDEV